MGRQYEPVSYIIEIWGSEKLSSCKRQPPKYLLSGILIKLYRSTRIPSFDLRQHNCPHFMNGRTDVAAYLNVLNSQTDDHTSYKPRTIIIFHQSFCMTNGHITVKQPNFCHMYNKQKSPRTISERTRVALWACSSVQFICCQMWPVFLLL